MYERNIGELPQMNLSLRFRPRRGRSNSRLECPFLLRPAYWRPAVHDSLLRTGKLKQGIAT